MILAALLAAVEAPGSAPDPALRARVERVLARTPIIDGHNDLAWELRDKYDARVEAVDLSHGTDALPKPLQTDIARLRRGHVGGQFWSVWVPATLAGPDAVVATLEQIDIVRRMIARYPETFAFANTAAEVRAAQKAGRIASLIGVEGGHQIDDRLAVLRQYKALGVAYMTITHSRNTAWAGSATDAPVPGGLTPFGRAVIAEMNRIGMIVDLSHVSAETMKAALAATKAPVMFSHSSAYSVDDHPRNVPDEVLRLLPANGGVVMVNVYPPFVSARVRDWVAARAAEQARLASSPAGLALGDPERAKALLARWEAAHPEPAATVAEVADHVQAIVRVAGIAHVGIGGDYDGIEGTGPVGMKGVDGWPLLFAELARRGFSDADLAALAGGNILRVMEGVERVAAAMRGEPPGDARIGIGGSR